MNRAKVGPPVEAAMRRFLLWCRAAIINVFTRAREGMSFMPIDWAPFVELVRTHKRFLLTTHIRPDGDGLGSMLALAEVLQQHGKDVRRVVASTLPPCYDFLDPERQVERFSPPGDIYRDADAVIVLDTCTWNQLGDFGPFLTTLPTTKAMID